MAVTSNESNAPILNIPPVPKTPCPVGASCGVCANCFHRARVMCASMAIDAQKRRGKTMNCATARMYARNRTIRLLSALGLIPAEMPEDARNELEEWAAYCEAMHELGMRGNLK